MLEELFHENANENGFIARKFSLKPKQSNVKVFWSVNIKIKINRKYGLDSYEKFLWDLSAFKHQTKIPINKRT